MKDNANNLALATQALADIANNVVTDSKEGWQEACLEKIKTAHDTLNKIYGRNLE